MKVPGAVLLPVILPFCGGDSLGQEVLVPESVCECQCSVMEQRECGG